MAISSKLLYLASGVNRSLDLLNASNVLQIRDSVLKIAADSSATNVMSFNLAAYTANHSLTFPDSNINFGSFARSFIAPGSANHVVINDGSGVLSSEAALSAVRGGLGLDASAFTGVVKAASGVFSASALVNADVDAAAAIAYSKLAALTANRALISDGSGFVSVSSVTSTELGYVSGVTSAIQGQINGKLSLSGGTMSGAINMGGNAITNLAAPSAGTDATTKTYVDDAVSAAIQGLSWKSPVVAATTGNITLSGAQTIDGVSVIAGDRVLVKDQSSPALNGIYVASAGAWSRASDMDALTPRDEFNGAAVFVLGGTINADRGFVETAAVATVGTDPVTFVQFSSAGSYSAGDGISIVGSTISVALAADPGLEFSSAALRIKLADSSLALSAGGVAVALAASSGLAVSSGLLVKVEASNPTLQINGSNELGVKLDAAGAIVTGASGIKVQLEASAPSLQISGNELGVKLDGTRGVAKDASGVFVKIDGSTITFNGSGQLQVGSSDATLLSFTSGEALTAGDAVYVSSSGTVSKAMANAESTSLGFVGLARSTVGSGAALQVIVGGRISGLSGLTAGSRYYLSAATAGASTTTAPSASGQQVALVGIAMSATELVVTPDFKASID